MRPTPFTDEDARFIQGSIESKSEAVQKVQSDFWLGTQIWFDLGNLTRSGWQSAKIDITPLRVSCEKWMRHTVLELSAKPFPTNYNAKARFAIQYVLRILNSKYSLFETPEVLGVTFLDDQKLASNLIRSILKKIFEKMTGNYDLHAISVAAHYECCNETHCDIPSVILKKNSNEMPFMKLAVSACMDCELRGVDNIAIGILFHKDKILEYIEEENAEPPRMVSNQMHIESLETIVRNLRKSCIPKFNNELWMNERKAIVNNEDILYWILDLYNKACPDLKIDRDSISDELDANSMSQFSDPWVQLTGRMLQEVGNIPARDLARRIVRLANQTQRLSRQFHLRNWLEYGDSVVWEKVLSDELIPWTREDPKRIVRALIIGAAAAKGLPEVINEIVNATNSKKRDELQKFLEVEFNKFVTTAPRDEEEDVREIDEIEMLAIAILVLKLSKAYEKVLAADIGEIRPRTLFSKLVDAYWEIRRDSVQIADPYKWSTSFFQSVMVRNVGDDPLLPALNSLKVESPETIVASIGEENIKSLKELLKGVRSYTTYRRKIGNKPDPIDLKSLFSIKEVEQLAPAAPVQHQNRAVTAICFIVSRSKSPVGYARAAQDYFTRTHISIISPDIFYKSFLGITNYRAEIETLFKLRFKSAATRLVSGRALGVDEAALLVGDAKPFRNYCDAIQSLPVVKRAGSDYRLILHSKAFIVACVILIASIVLLVVDHY